MVKINKNLLYVGEHSAKDCGCGSETGGKGAGHNRYC